MRRTTLLLVLAAASTTGCASALYHCKANDTLCKEEARRADDVMARIAVDTAAVAFETAVADQGNGSASEHAGAATTPPATATPATPAPAPAPATTTPSPAAAAAPASSADAPSRFDRRGAAAALRIALEYAARCRGGSTGPVTAVVSFAPSGASSVTTLTGDGVADVRVHDCVRARLDQARVGPFGDGQHTAKLSFVVQPPDPATDPP